MNGLINVHKSGGMTSRAVVDHVARLLPRVKVGHAGTLDPLATGVLVLCVGSATRLIEYVQARPKTYRTVVLLGARSDTLDADGNVEAVANAEPPTAEAVARAVATQVGTIAQKPPEFSAIKVAGQRAYDLARAGKTVELAARPVTIHRIDVLRYEWPRLELEVHCEGGTYIRSIARDLGEILGCGGLVEVLVRTRIGGFAIEDAVELERIDAQSVGSLLLPPLRALEALPQLALTSEEAAEILRGRAIPARAVEHGGEVALTGPDDVLLSVGRFDLATGKIAPTRVFPPSS